MDTILKTCVHLRPNHFFVPSEDDLWNEHSWKWKEEMKHEEAFTGFIDGGPVQCMCSWWSCASQG
jgi:hypothetical protein